MSPLLASREWTKGTPLPVIQEKRSSFCPKSLLYSIQLLHSVFQIDSKCGLAKSDYQTAETDLLEWLDNIYREFGYKTSGNLRENAEEKKTELTGWDETLAETPAPDTAPERMRERSVCVCVRACWCVLIVNLCCEMGGVLGCSWAVFDEPAGPPCILAKVLSFNQLQDTLNNSWKLNLLLCQKLY